MYRTLESYEKAHEQGDGVRSYLGIALYLAIDYYAGLFIDEPESFLHPPQAEAMGNLLASDMTEGRQLFIATHSKELLAGLLQMRPDRLKIVRVTRTTYGNSIAILDTADVAKISSTTLLKHSDLMNSLFHEATVLCEADGDCKFYGAIFDHIPRDERAVSDALFLPVGGKHRAKVFAELLGKLAIKRMVICDADLIGKDTKTLKDLISTCNGDWSEVRDDWTTIRDSFEVEKTVHVTMLKSQIEAVLDGNKGDAVTNDTIQGVQKLLKRPSRWSDVKRLGERAFSGDALSAYRAIRDALEKIGIYLVPCGELEGFVGDVANLHGPDWVNEVFERYPGLDDGAYDEVKDFIGKWARGANG